VGSDTADIVDRIRRHYEDGCFACGRENPIGLRLDRFEYAGGEVTAVFDPRHDYRGAGTTLHGGIAATALDEIMVWAGLLGEKVMSVTANLTLRYRRPVHVDEPITVGATVGERNGRRLTVTGTLMVDGETRVEGSGLYLVTASLEELGIL
jgi:acyl-coenzyme A thioesterase PaaI-like protein